MNTSRLMIVAGEKAWTLAALHLACAISRRSGIELLLVKMIPVRHPFDLGTSAGFLNYGAADAQFLDDLRPTISWTPSITLQNRIAHSIEEHQSGETS